MLTRTQNTLLSTLSHPLQRIGNDERERQGGRRRTEKIGRRRGKSRYDKPLIYPFGLWST